MQTCRSARIVTVVRCVRNASRVQIRSLASGGGGSGPDVIVVGGGAAGLTAAYFAAEGGARVTVLERTKECGKKILMSGGTRANVLPFVAGERDYCTESSRGALARIFRTWTLEECHEWLSSPEGIGLALGLEEETNKWFPLSNSSREVRDKLLEACTRRGVRVRYNSSTEGLRRIEAAQPPAEAAAAAAGGAVGDAAERDRGREASTADGGGGAGAAAAGPKAGKARAAAAAGGAGQRTRWACVLKDGATVEADRVILATGGLSFPAVGTDGTGHRIAREQLGHSLNDPYPALVPLTGAHPGGAQLAGLSLQTVDLRSNQGKGGGKKARSPPPSKPAPIWAATTKADRGGFLFTHRGFSGPSVLDLSHMSVLAKERGAAEPPALFADWTGEGREAWEERLAENGRQLVVSVVSRHVPSRLAEALCTEAGIPEGRRQSELRREERIRLLELLTRYQLPVTGHQGYAKAEVTGGGVPLEELSAVSLESKRAPGVFVCGELVDVFGRIGGFNFYWAWVSGRLAGRAAAAPFEG